MTLLARGKHSSCPPPTCKSKLVSDCVIFVQLSRDRSPICGRVRICGESCSCKCPSRCTPYFYASSPASPLLLLLPPSCADGGFASRGGSPRGAQKHRGSGPSLAASVSQGGVPLPISQTRDILWDFGEMMCKSAYDWAGYLACAPPVVSRPQ